MKLIKLSDEGFVFEGEENECRDVLSEYICKGCYEDLVEPTDFYGVPYPYDGSSIVRETLDDLLMTPCGSEFTTED